MYTDDAIDAVLLITVVMMLAIAIGALAAYVQELTYARWKDEVEKDYAKWKINTDHVIK